MLFIFTLPESPRFLLQQAHRAPANRRRRYYSRAFRSLCRLNRTKLQACREMILLHYSLKNEERLHWQKAVRSLWTEQRTWNALIASLITMFMQQFCGVNIMAYYSTLVIKSLAGFTDSKDKHPFLVSYSLHAIVCGKTDRDTVFFWLWPHQFLLRSPCHIPHGLLGKEESPASNVSVPRRFPILDCRCCSKPCRPFIFQRRLKLEGPHSGDRYRNVSFLRLLFDRGRPGSIRGFCPQDKPRLSLTVLKVYSSESMPLNHRDYGK